MSERSGGSGVGVRGGDGTEDLGFGERDMVGVDACVYAMRSMSDGKDNGIG